MGWRYRKSINLGLGFRINISKSGIGYSWGVPGYRKTWKADGGTRTTYSIPGTGLSYVEESSAQCNHKKRGEGENLNQSDNFNNTKVYPVENGKIDAVSTPENKLFVKKIKSIRLKNFFTWVVCAVLVWSWFCLDNIVPDVVWLPILLSLLCLSLVLGFFTNARRFVLVDYEFDDVVEEILFQRNSALACLLKCEKIWDIEQYRQIAYSKENAGAEVSVSRRKAKLVYECAPRYIKLTDNMKVYQLLINRTRYIFLPDKILVVRFFQVGALSYSDLSVTLKTTEFVDDEETPSDAEFLCNTWQYVNYDGTPDRRFRENQKLPVYIYAKIILTSETGLNLHLMVSSRTKAEEFMMRWDEIEEIL